MSYYNTNKLKGFELKEADRKANTQEDRILQFFKSNSGKNFTPEEIQSLCLMANRPLTSVRRAISNLTREGYLRKTNLMKQGNYGKQVHTWEYRGQANQEKLW